jgi:hypothetical protein
MFDGDSICGARIQRHEQNSPDTHIFSEMSVMLLQAMAVHDG